MTSTRDHVHSESFDVDSNRLFRLLHTPSAIRQWWGVERAIVLPQTDGIWAATWGTDEDEPDYVTVATISVFDAPNRMLLTRFRYHSRSGPLPFEADFETDFVVEDNDSGSRLTVTQRGFPAGPEADEYYTACQKGWTETFAGIRKFLGAATPPPADAENS